MSKRQIVLRVESEKGVEEHSFDVLTQQSMNSLIYAIFTARDVRISNKKRLEIVNNSSDERLIFWALSELTSDLSDKKLEELYQKFVKSEDVQCALVAYCDQKHKNAMLEKLASKGATQRVRSEAEECLKR